MSEIPSRWITTTAIAVAEPVRGVTYKKEQARSASAPGLTAILRANNIQRDKLDLSDLVFVPNENVSENQMLRKHDIVIAMSSGSISVVGKSAQLREGLAASFGAFCGALRPSKEIEPRYLGCFLKSNAYRAAISELAHGVNINNLKWSHFEEIPLPLAPLPEQKRIADKLDTVLARVDACRDRLDRVPALLKRFRQSILAAATSGRLTEDWRTARSPDEAQRNQGFGAEVSGSGPFAETPLRDLLLSIDQGWSPKCDNEPATSCTEWAVIKTTSIQGIIFSDIENKRLPLSLPPRQNLELRSGDVLITRAGPRARAGVCCLVKQTRPRLLLCDKAYRLRPNASLISSEYLTFFLNAPDTVEVIDSLKTGISESGVNLTQQRFLDLLVRTPSQTEQAEIVRRVEILFAFADRLEARLTTARKQVGQLTPALLAKAFRGELVPQDPNDEPAAELLKRLATAPKAKRGRKTKVA